MTTEFESELRALIAANRVRALWSLPRDYFPPDEASARRILEKIAARGDRQTWVRARQMLRELN
ncbi:MAG: hypothetical protein KY445_16120 [Armatimonadetes bacterium]|nr:hypothetical protein [Armatimonadota bacterium]